MANSERLQVRLTPTEMGKLEKLQELGGLRSLRDAVSTVISLGFTLVQEKMDGCDIYVSCPQGRERVLLVPYLEDIAAAAREAAAEESEGSEETPEVTDAPTGNRHGNVRPIVSAGGGGD